MFPTKYLGKTSKLLVWDVNGRMELLPSEKTFGTFFSGLRRWIGDETVLPYKACKEFMSLFASPIIIGKMLVLLGWYP